MKKVIIIFVVLLIIAAGAFVVFGLLNNKNNQPASTVPEPTTGALGDVSAPSQTINPSIMNFPNAPKGATFALGTSQGLVTINNFYNLPLVIDEEFLILENTNDYQITYDTDNDQFFIYASSSPLDVARQKGEAAFLSLLGISQQDACKLNVLEGFPQGSPMANTQLELSFCSSGGAFQSP